ncbi:MAG: class I SAM-dependent RNA methyltransferase [Bdellovibrionales bacterium]|nr:class I SAM-dependent RNA methyltransferase [Bdellovibrionales bacterium]
MLKDKNSHFFASCPAGLEEILLNEIKQITNIKKLSVENGGVDLFCSSIQAIKILINSRIASRVFLYLESFTLANEKDLYHFANNINWNKYFTLKQTFKNNVLLDREAQNFFKNSHHLALVVKDAIVDNFRSKTNTRPDINLKNPDISFLTRITKNERKFKANILVDLCGRPLSNRGYRVQNHIAPLRENLAAGLILLSNWNSEQQVIYDPMCGSGTILTEAAMINLGLPGSYLKIIDYKENKSSPFAFLDHIWFIENSELQREVFSLFDRTYSEIDNILSEEISEIKIFGSDLSYDSINVARANLEAARLTDFIKIKSDDCTSVLPPDLNEGVIICNPPYGERLESDNLTELENLYHNFGENLKKNFKGFTAYLITSTPGLRKKISLQTSKRIKLYNGPLECRLLEYKLF